MASAKVVRGLILGGELAVLGALSVWWNERIAGVLSIDRGDAMHFAYAPEWLADDNAPPLSQALSKQAEPFGDHLCKAVFGGLLPEEGQRTAIALCLNRSPAPPAIAQVDLPSSLADRCNTFRVVNAIWQFAIM